MASSSLRVGFCARSARVWGSSTLASFHSRSKGEKSAVSGAALDAVLLGAGGGQCWGHTHVVHVHREPDKWQLVEAPAWRCLTRVQKGEGKVDMGAQRGIQLARLPGITGPVLQMLGRQTGANVSIHSLSSQLAKSCPLRGLPQHRLFC